MKTEKILVSMLIAVLCAAIVILWIRIDAKIRVNAEKACLYECRSLTSAVVADSIAQTLRTVSELDLTLTAAGYDENGSITGIRTNADAVNTVQSLLLEQINAAMDAQRDAEYTISLGTLTGMYTLTGRGAEIPLRYVPRGSASVELESSFSSAGINQTLHTLTATITVDAGCSVPLYQADTTLTYTYLLAETVIVGDVPEVTWSGKIFPAA